MPIYFLPGPFADPDALRAIFGAAGASVEAIPALLADHVLRADAHGPRLVLVAAPGASADGALVAPSSAAVAALAFAMAAFGGERRRVTVAGRGAEAFVAAGPDLPPVALSVADWTGERRTHVLEVLGEVMAHFGRRSPGEMPDLLPGIAFRALARTRGRATATPVALRSGLTAADVEPVDPARPYARFFGIEEHALRHRRFDGRMSPVVQRSVFVSGDAVTVLPFDPVRGSVVLIEQFRAGAHARRDPRPWFLEAVAGRCDPNETPGATARREAVEEAGLTLGRLERIAAYYTTPGIAAEYITAFVGEADLGAAGGVFGLAEEDEDIRVHVVPLERALAAMAEGEINNAPLLISLLWLARNRDRIAAAWASG